MSPQWLAVRVRARGGLIPAFGDSFFCSCKGGIGSTANVIMQVYCSASNLSSSHHSFAINEPCHLNNRCRRIEGTIRLPITSFTVPSIPPYKEKQIYVVWRSALNPSSRASVAWRSAFYRITWRPQVRSRARSAHTRFQRWGASQETGTN